jgi:hypothetical protein
LALLQWGDKYLTDAPGGRSRTLQALT